MPDSWWLKFKRAQRHMVEVRHAARLYAKRQPYEISRIREPKGKRNVWRYRLAFDPPDPMTVMMLGDFIHNLRSALDHIVVACSPPGDRKNASFPIETQNLFARDAQGEFVHPDADARERFKRAIRGLSDRAKAIVIDAQPYRRNPATDIIGILSRLENADKHRQLIAIATGLRGASISLTIRDIPHSTHTIKADEFFYDGAQVFSFTVVNPKLTEAEVKVKCSGSATIGIKLTGIEGHEGVLEFPIYSTMLRALKDVRLLLRVLERFAIRA